MPIDISNVNNTNQTKRTTDNKLVKVVSGDSQNRSDAGSEAGSKAADSVSLTDSALRIKTVEEQVARLPIVDTQKVENIKNAIANGTFEFNAERIADKMIQQERELF